MNTTDEYIFVEALGTPSSQKLLRLFVIWNYLAVVDLAEMSKLSKSQIHTTLNNFKKWKIVSWKSKGNYQLSNTAFVNHLREGYMSVIREAINSEIYHIQTILNNKEIEEAKSRFNNLVEVYRPILEESFSEQLSSLSHQFIEVYGED